MAVLKRHQRATYTVIDNGALRDETLSWRATGLLAYLLSLPDDWTINTAHLARQKTDGRTSTRSAMSELEAAGYVARRKERQPNGQLTTIVHCAETPQILAEAVGSPTPGKPTSGTPTPVKPTDGNQPTTKELDEVPRDETPTTKELSTGDVSRETHPERIQDTTVQETTPRPANPAWDGLEAVFGYRPTTDTERKLWGRLAARINAEDHPDPADEVITRAKRLFLQWGARSLTVTSLEKHWDRFGSPIGKLSETDQERVREDWERELRRRRMEATEKGLAEETG